MILTVIFGTFLSDPGIPGLRSMGPSLSNSLYVCAAYVTLADEDTNSILADNANRAIQGNVAMQVTQPGRKICYASGAIWWPTMQLM